MSKYNVCCERNRKEHHEHKHHDDRCGHEHDHSCCKHNHEHNHDCCEHNHHSCGCEHNHADAKVMVARLAAGAIIAAVGYFVPDGWAKFAVYLAAYLILGYDVLKTAVKNIFKGKIFDENFLMCIATLGAFALREYPEAAAVMLFYQIGELLSHNAAEKSRSSIAALMDVRPDTARVMRDGDAVMINCKDIAVGETVIVAAGERIPIDGTILRGAAMLDTSSLTGESVPRAAAAGEQVLAGMISTDGSLEIRVDKEFGESTLSRILELAEHAQEKKSSSERFITTFAHYYTPAVVAAAVLTAFVPPLFGLGSYAVWIARALNFLVISCPCALVVSVPLTFFAGIGCASRNGVLIKNGMALENLSKVKTAAFDKTGTLTVGKPRISEIRADGAKAELLMLAAYAESDSTHPIARAVSAEWHEPIDRTRIGRITEIAARGVEAVIDGKTVLAGSEKLLAERNIAVNTEHLGKNAVYVAVDSCYRGYLAYSDSIKPESAPAVEQLKKLGIASVMLSGDTEASAAAAAEIIGIDEVHAGLLPQDKARLIGEREAVLFVGDGINDAPSLASASVGMAMGGIGSDAAIESADAVIMGDEPSKIPFAVNLSKRVMRIVRQNTIFSIGVKIAVMLISLIGFGGMWPAIFADVGVCVIAVANALRAFRLRQIG